LQVFVAVSSTRSPYQRIIQRGLDADKLATDTYGDQLTLAIAAKDCPANHWQLSLNITRHGTQAKCSPHDKTSQSIK